MERAKEKLESYSLNKLPERQMYLNALYRMVARAYTDPRDLRRLDDEDAHNRLRKQMGLKAKGLPREADLAWPPTLNLRQAFDTCRQRLQLASQPLELIWLFHELCKLFLEIHRYDMAR